MAEENWWPSKEVYNPGLTKEDWRVLLGNKDVFTYNSMCLLHRYIDIGGTATCSDISQNYGNSPQSHNGTARQLAERICKLPNIKQPPEREANAKWWPILFVGRHVSDADENNGTYIWKLRDELKQALDDIDLSEYKLYEKEKFLKLETIYKGFYKSHEKEAFYDEEYKWKLITETQNSSECDIALAIGKENITDRKRINSVLMDLVSNNSNELTNIVKKLFADNVDLIERIRIFNEDIKNLCVNKEFKVLPNDERTASAFLTCHDPKTYTFYMDTKTYEPLCGFLGIAKKPAKEKYAHFLKIMYEFETYLKEDSELLQWFEDKANSYNSSTLLIAQNIIYVLNCYGFLRKKRFWFFNHTYINASEKDVSDLIAQAKTGNFAFMQYEYNKQENKVVTLTYKNIRNIRQGDYIFLRGGNYIYGYGKSIEPRKLCTRELNLDKIIESNNCEFNSSNSVDVIGFEDAPVFYFDFSVGEENWGERIDVDKWILFSNPKNISEINVQYKDKLPYPPVREITEETANNLLQGEKMIKDNKIDYYKNLLKSTHNLILHGAPGTGKTYLAREIAKAMGCGENEIDFVQFHPSYDYTDFVEGLRPVNGENAQIGFERKDGMFKKFCEKALKESKINGSDNFSEIWEKIINELNENNFVNVPLLSGRDTMRIELNEYGDGLANRTYENDDYVKGNWLRGQSKFFTKEQCYNIYKGLPGIPSGGHDNYRKAIVKYMKDKMGLVEYKEGTVTANIKPFVFIIDEINRGEMSKIFGELFFSIDPGYRGEKGKIKTQYQNLIEPSNVFYDGFFIPENVYIIGTMNDIDRKKPLRAVFRDSSFSNSASKINVFEIFKMISPETSVKVI